MQNAQTANRRNISMAYYANCIVQDGIAKKKSDNAIRADLRYVCEYSEVLGQRDVETIMDIGHGRRVA
jgi:hypothetical protein